VSAIRVWGVVRIILAVLLAIRIGRDAIAALRRKSPGTRLIVPGAALAALFATVGNLLGKSVAGGMLLAVDLLLLFICIRFVRDVRQTGGEFLEQRLECALLAYFPEILARFMSTELTIMVNALRGIRLFVSPPRSGAESYVGGSKLPIIAMIVTVSVIPDAVLSAMLLPHHLVWLAILSTGLEIWASMWLWGLFGTMASRPHTITSTKIELRNGILAHVALAPAQIASTESLGILRRAKLPRGKAPRAILGFGGVPMVEVRLSEPAAVNSALGAKSRLASRLFVATDSPTQFCTMIDEIARHARRSSTTA